MHLRLAPSLNQGRLKASASGSQGRLCAGRGSLECGLSLRSAALRNQDRLRASASLERRLHLRLAVFKAASGPQLQGLRARLRASASGPQGRLRSGRGSFERRSQLHLAALLNQGRLRASASLERRLCSPLVALLNQGRLKASVSFECRLCLCLAAFVDRGRLRASGPPLCGQRVA